MKKKKEKGRKVKRGKVASRKAAEGLRRLGRLPLMQQLAVMRMMRPFGHALPIAQHSSSYQPSSPGHQSHLGLQCRVRLPGWRD